MLNSLQKEVVKEMQRRLIIAKAEGLTGEDAPSNTCPEVIIIEAYENMFSVKIGLPYDDIEYDKLIWGGCSTCVKYLHIADKHCGNTDGDPLCPCYREPDFNEFMEHIDELVK